MLLLRSMKEMCICLRDFRLHHSKRFKTIHCGVKNEAEKMYLDKGDRDKNAHILSPLCISLSCRHGYNKRGELVSGRISEVTAVWKTQSEYRCEGREAHPICSVQLHLNFSLICKYLYPRDTVRY